MNESSPKEILTQAHQALKTAAAFDALAASGCQMSHLVVALMTPHMGVNEAGDVTVVDENGELRRSASGLPMTTHELVRELRRDRDIDQAWRVRP